MTVRKMILVCTVSLASMLAAASCDAQSAHAQTAPQSARVRALGTLQRVVGHTQRLITAKNYARLPHENDEFKEGLEALERSMAGDSADLRVRVEPLLKQAQADSQGVADAATAHDDAGLATAHAALADSVKAVLAAFPESVPH